jgi:hypothetical protein
VRWFRRNPALGGAASLAMLALLAVTVVSIMYAAEQANAARRFKELSNASEVEGEHTRDALRETNQQLAIVALERAQSQRKNGETGRGLLHLAEAVRFAREADDAELERSARTSIGIW